MLENCRIEFYSSKQETSANIIQAGKWPQTAPIVRCFACLVVNQWFSIPSLHFVRTQPTACCFLFLERRVDRYQEFANSYRSMNIIFQMVRYNCAVNTWVMLGTCRVESIQLPSALILRRKETRRGASATKQLGTIQVLGGLDFQVVWTEYLSIHIYIYIYNFKILYIYNYICI